MVKLFFIGIGVVILATLGVWPSAPWPLLAGVLRTPGSSPRLPFHVPIPQPAVDTVRGWLVHITPSMWLAAVRVLVALVLVYTASALVTALARRWGERRRGHQEVAATSDADTAEYEALWK